MTTEDSVKPEPFRKICSGAEEMKARLLTVGEAIGSASDAVLAEPSMTACRASAACTAPQPLSRYCSVTVAAGGGEGGRRERGLALASRRPR
ncbi:MAG: hypothetical protein U5L05_13730 [Rubrivivax sp.]|nr:hypothetical protein [Rubrivivax sp.]